jgi:hypothetical protein
MEVEDDDENDKETSGGGMLGVAPTTTTTTTRTPLLLGPLLMIAGICILLLNERHAVTRHRTAWNEHAHAEFSVHILVLRIVGFVVVWVGLLQSKEPLQLEQDPFVVDVENGGVAAILSSAMTFTTIAISWLLDRPFLAMGLFFLVPGLVEFARFCHQLSLDDEGGRTEAVLLELSPTTMPHDGRLNKTTRKTRRIRSEKGASPVIKT